MARKQPKYQNVLERLAGRIAAGELRPGDQLPSEPDLAEEYGVAYMTVRRAVATLVQSGELNRVRGRGTFVAPPQGVDKKPSLGLLLVPKWHSLDPFYFPPLVSAFVDRAEEMGFQVHLADRSEPLLEILRFRDLRVRAVACVVLGRSDLLDAHALMDRGVMVVAINHYGGRRRVPSVSPDNRGGSYEITKRLIEIGHREFVFLAGPTPNLDAAERRSGVESAVQDAGLPAESLVVLEGGFIEDSGLERAKTVLALKQLPTAAICASDLSAIGLMKGLKKLGIRVPEDVSVVGFGDFRLSAYFEPALTTVHLPLEEIGRQSADALIAQYRGIRVDSVCVACPVVWRESAAPI